VPQLGDVPLQRLTAAQVNAVYAMLLGRLAPGTVRQVHAVLHRALEAAVRWAYVVRNVADAADPPTPTRKREIRTWTAGELAGLLAAAEGHQASDAFSRLVKRSGVPRIGGIHALRHGWATLALQAGVHPKVVAERLGHASVRITLDTYSHVAAGMQEDAAATVARLVGLD
jgi:integrase